MKKIFMTLALTMMLVMTSCSITPAHAHAWVEVSNTVHHSEASDTPATPRLM